jgi:VWFA-related protein
MRAWLSPILLAPAAALALLATGPSSAAAETRTVALVVTDAQGAFVPDLRVDEVRVLENGEACEVVSFEKDERPLSVALVLDASDEAQRVFRGLAIPTVRSFLAHLPPGVRCTLWTTGDRAKKMGELKGDAAAIEKTIARGFGSGGSNALLETLVEAAAALSAESGRRRALVAVTGRASGHTSWGPGDVVSRVRRAGGRVFGVLYREGSPGQTGSLMGLDAPRDAANLTVVGEADHERILSGLAQGTGGRFESVGTATAVSRMLEAYAAELVGQYRVRFAVAEAKGPKRIEARVARPGLRWRVAVDSP